MTEQLPASPEVADAVETTAPPRHPIHLVVSDDLQRYPSFSDE